jgi:diguanylate cyclase (GGDEF)-like protein
MLKYKYAIYGLILLFLLTILGAAYALYTIQYDYLQKKIDKDLMLGVKSTALLLDGLHNKKLLDKKIPKSEDYKNILKLSDFVKESDLSYVYSFMQDKNGTIYFTSSSATEEELENNSSDIYSFDVYSDPKLTEAFQTMKPVFGESIDKWGHFRSLYVPMRAADGSVFVVGADYKLQNIHKLDKYIRAEIIYLFIPLLLLLIISGLIFYVLTQEYERRIEEQKKELAMLYETDQVTQLPNRTRLLKDISQRESVKIALFDIYKFKNINITYGTKNGDRCLLLIAQFLHNLLTEDMQLYKLHADHFCIVSNSKDTLLFREKITAFLFELEKQSFTFENYAVNFYFCVGLSCSLDTNNPLFAAEIALHEAKETGKHLVVYNPQLEQQKSADRHKILMEISYAVEHHKIYPFFQPIYDLHTKKIRKFESLMRLEKQNGEVVALHGIFYVLHSRLGNIRH